MDSKTHYLSQEYRRLVFSKTFGFLLILNLFLLLYPVVYEIILARGARSHLFYYTDSFFWNRGFVIVIITCTALICKSIPDDLNFGMVRYIVSRIHREHYVYIKCLSVLLAVLSLLVFTNILRTVFIYGLTKLMATSVDASLFVNQLNTSEHPIFQWGFAHPILFYIRKIVLTSLSTSLWVLSGAIVSAKYSNIYLTLSFPAIAYYLVINIFSSLFGTPYLAISNLGSDDINLGSFALSFTYPLAFFLLLNVILYFLLTITLRRRIHEI